MLQDVSTYGIACLTAPSPSHTIFEGKILACCKVAMTMYSDVGGRAKGELKIRLG